MAPSGRGLAVGQLALSFCPAESRWRQAILAAVKLVVAPIGGLERLSSLTFVFGLDGLSPIGVWDVLGGGSHDGHGTG